VFYNAGLHFNAWGHKIRAQPGKFHMSKMF